MCHSRIHIRKSAFYLDYSSSGISFAFVFFLVLSETALFGELSFVSDALCFLTAEADAMARGRILLIGVAVAFPTVPFPELGFACLWLHSLRLVHCTTSPRLQFPGERLG